MHNMPDATLPLHEAIAREKRRALTEGTVADALGSVGGVFVVLCVAYAHSAHFALLAWACGMLLVLAGQFAFPRLMARASQQRFLSGYAALGVVLGLAWASCAVLVRPDNFGFEAFVVLALCVVFTAGSVFNAHHLPMLYGFQIAGQGTLALIYALRGGTLNWGIAAGFAILMWTLIGYGRAFHRGFVRAIELGFENARLVGELTAKTQALEQANLAKTRFLASASHDLRQPLHAMSLLIGLLGERARGLGVEDLVQRIGQSTEAMESLLNGILDISRLDAGVERPEPVALPVQELLAGIERQFAPLAAARGLSLRTHAAAHWVRSDRALLARMLDNLVANALRYTERGGVLVGVRPHGDGLAFEVWDSGIGIPADQFDAVFQEFVQLHNPQRDRSLGLGLGLSIVRRTAELLGHRVELCSRHGRGSRFRVIVPRGAPASAAEPALAGARQAEPVAGLRVLVIDDEAPIRFALQGLLDAWGCEGVVARDGADALARLDDGLPVPDAILCDYRFEQGTGVEWVGRLRERLGADVPALIVTGDVTASQLIDIAASDLPVMHKPVSPAALRAWLGRVALTARPAVSG
ncbi:response regulator [Pelomonas aquatica]|jgi:signal transduction histidine kinase/CheY-like chemotaxis protein|uniref:histidine kinase n=2 Tax=Pelomonas aquatica TaxID=431058 RepID=A0A9X4LHB9_9BURK|nr:response regulator [Pelomonas aquatica]